MSLHPITQAAYEIANRARQSQSNLDAEKAKLERRILELEAQIKHNKAAADRLATFSLHRDGVYQCPSCWVIHEIAADLTPIPNGDGEDHFRCSNCRNEFVVPAP